MAFGRSMSIIDIIFATLSHRFAMLYKYEDLNIFPISDSSLLFYRFNEAKFRIITVERYATTSASEAQ